MMGLGRPCAGAQPELCPRLVSSGFCRLLGWPAVIVAIEHVETAMRLSPRDRVGLSPARDRRGAFLQPALRRGGTEAAPARFRTIRASPAHPRALAACYALIWERARRCASRRSRRLRALPPGPERRCLRLPQPEHRELFLSGLRLAAGEDMSQTRRLAAILAADVAGYSRLMGADEEGTLERLKALRTASRSIRELSTTAASSRPPATACGGICAASSEGAPRRCGGGAERTRVRGGQIASNCASESISAT